MSEPMDIDFLIRAGSDNENITIYHKTELGKGLTYRSRFFEINPKKKYIIIDSPVGEKGTYQQLVRKDKITGFFISRGFRFLFHTVVLKRDKFKLHGEVDVPVLIIRMPGDIYDGERRDFYRVPAPLDPLVKVKFVSYFESGQSFDTQKMPGLEDFGRSEAVLHDLSGGGLSVRSKEELSIMIGDIINMRFSFRSGSKENIRIEGLINNSRKSADKNAIIKGIEFLPDRNDAYRDAIKKISRYVMERQRQMINPYGKD